MKTLSLHIMDITENSIRAKASLVRIEVESFELQDRILIRITDNGCGMDKEQVKSVMDPFFTSRTSRKVGLGIPLFKQNAEMSGGAFKIDSTLGKGTVTEATFGYNHLDRPAMGNLAETIVLLACGNSALDFEFYFTSDKGNYTFKTTEIKEIFGAIDISMPDVVVALRELVESNLEEL